MHTNTLLNTQTIGENTPVCITAGPKHSLSAVKTKSHMHVVMVLMMAHTPHRFINRVTSATHTHVD